MASAGRRAVLDGGDRSVIAVGRRVAAGLLGTSTVSRAVHLLARARGHRLVLVYHRVGPSPAAGCEVSPSVSPELFRTHLAALGEVVEFVTLDDVLSIAGRRPRADGRPRPQVAVTLDDDLPTHVEHVLPILKELQIPGAFFLSGRALHGLGPYWFQRLELLLTAQGAGRAAVQLGLSPESGAADLARLCERDQAARDRLERLTAALSPASVLSANEAAILVGAGMTIGFHTIDHRVLLDLDDVALDDAVSRGRTRLAAAAGAPVRYFAYPHGKADARVAAAVSRAGFDAAFTGRPGPLRMKQDRYRLGRWEPGPLGVDDLLVKLAVRLHRESPEAAS